MGTVYSCVDFRWQLIFYLCRIFGSGVGASINFVEEILPFTDICPTATLRKQKSFIL